MKVKVSINVDGLISLLRRVIAPLKGMTEREHYEGIRAIVRNHLEISRRYEAWREAMVAKKKGRQAANFTLRAYETLMIYQIKPA